MKKLMIIAVLSLAAIAAAQAGGLPCPTPPPCDILPVPEPSTYAFGIVGGMAAIGMFLKNRRSNRK